MQRGSVSLPLVIQCDGLRVVRHKHVVRPFERPEHQRVDWVLLDILFNEIVTFNTMILYSHKTGNISTWFYSLNTSYTGNEASRRRNAIQHLAGPDTVYVLEPPERERQKTPEQDFQLRLTSAIVAVSTRKKHHSGRKLLSFLGLLLDRSQKKSITILKTWPITTSRWPYTPEVNIPNRSEKCVSATYRRGGVTPM